MTMMKMLYTRSWSFDGTMSPYPTVVMVVKAQYKAARYLRAKEELAAVSEGGEGGGAYLPARSFSSSPMNTHQELTPFRGASGLYSGSFG
jgi:hypothetical protein